MSDSILGPERRTGLVRMELPVQWVGTITVFTSGLKKIVWMQGLVY